MKRKLIKSEEVEWFEETIVDGERRIRVETTTKVYFKEDGSNNHNPTKVIINEYVKTSEFFLEKAQIKFVNAILDKISKSIRKVL